MEQLYNKIKENLQKIDFCAIWQDFKPCEEDTDIITAKKKIHIRNQAYI